ERAYSRTDRQLRACAGWPYRGAADAAPNRQEAAVRGVGLSMDKLIKTAAPAVPSDAPLAMPTQSLRAQTKASRPRTGPRLIGLRRIFVIGGAIAMTVEGVREMYFVLGGAGLTVLQFVILALYATLSA